MSLSVMVQMVVRKREGEGGGGVDSACHDFQQIDRAKVILWTAASSKFDK